MKFHSALIRAFLISIAFAGFVCTQGLTAGDDVADLKAQVAKLRGEVETLKAENETLIKENQSLRRIVASPQQQTTITPVQKPLTIPAAVQSPPSQQKTSGYWITTSSGVRHNSSCRYYMNSRGRACGPNEGRACKICGG